VFAVIIRDASLITSIIFLRASATAEITLFWNVNTVMRGNLYE